MSKTVILRCAVEGATGLLACGRGTGRVGTTWVWDWVGTGRVIPVPTQLLEEGRHDSEAGPGRACRALEWVVMPGRTYWGAAVLTTLRARSVSLQDPSLSGPPLYPPPGQ